MERSVTIRVFLTCWLVYAAYFTPYIVREHFPAIALVERGSLNVERYLGWIEDIFQSSHGGAYINNNPGASVAGAIPLLLFTPLLKSAGQLEDRVRVTSTLDGPLFARLVVERRATEFLSVAFLTVAALMAPLTAGCAAFLSWKSMQAGVRPIWAAGIGLLFAFGTPLFFRTAYLNHNMLVADAALVAFLLLWDKDGKPLSKLQVFAAGLLAGFSVLCDLSGVVLVAGAGLYVLVRAGDGPREARAKTVLWYTLGVVPFIAALMLYYYVAFGEPLRPSQHYMPPTAPTSVGYRGFSWVSPSLVWANFFDPRFGLFAFGPLLLLGFAGPFVRRISWRIPKREAIVLGTFATLHILFCAANQYSWLQPSTGFRYLAPVVFVFLLFTVQALAAMPTGWRVTLPILAMFHGWILAAAHTGQVHEAISRLIARGWQLPWMYRATQLGLIESGWFWPVAVHAGLGVSLAGIWYGFFKQEVAA